MCTKGSLYPLNRMYLLYSVDSYRSWKGLIAILGEGTTSLPKQITPRKISHPPIFFILLKLILKLGVADFPLPTSCAPRVLLGREANSQIIQSSVDFFLFFIKILLKIYLIEHSILGTLYFSL